MKNTFIYIAIIFSQIAFGLGKIQSVKAENEFSALDGSGPFNCPNCVNKLNQDATIYPTAGMLGYPPSGNFGVTNSPDDGKQPKSTLQSTTTLLGTLIDNLPDKNLQNGLREYIKIVNPQAYGNDGSVGGSNAGLAEWFGGKFSKNQCFRDSAMDFYRDVALTMNKQNKCEAEPRSKEGSAEEICNVYGCSNYAKIKPEIEYGCFASRPSINDAVGKGSKSYLHEGWMWELAMKHAKGSPEAALELIGMCGHDDTAQGRFGFYDDSEKAKLEIQKEIDDYKNQKKSIDIELKKSFQKFDTDNNKVYKLSKKSEFLTQRISGLKEQTGKMSAMQCPPKDSDFYLPGSLASNADISQNLKNKINSIQNTNGKNFVPAKNYHIYGSAFLGCKMSASGLTTDQAVTVQTQAARLYRGLRMCESSQKELAMRQKLASDYAVDIEDSKKVEEKVLEIWSKKNKKQISCPEFYAFGGFGFYGKTMDTSAQVKQADVKADLKQIEKDSKDCKILNQFGISKLESNESEIVKKKIATGWSRYDAAHLYDKWYFGGGSVLDKKIPCTNIRGLRGPTDLMNPAQSIMGKLSKPSGWSDDRYKAATQKLATWDVDFEWTVAQHEAGSKFGANICKTDSKKSPFSDDKKQCLKPASPYEYDGRMPSKGLDGNKPANGIR